MNPDVRHHHQIARDWEIGEIDRKTRYSMRQVRQHYGVTEALVKVKSAAKLVILRAPQKKKKKKKKAENWRAATAHSAKFILNELATHSTPAFVL